ncbi:DNA mismatch repair endonuclease MutL [Pantoea sp. SoEX]|uniref:DNA mismatch repair endonuclease MutL n=1 Tax=Pantoea sp. SoEX TaxID=2576763 RepID=UPI0013568309|nr:DNA mismatch repair endonuclease MutL [Pantoea sp. SoEX]MXP51332.1 DNA mismatch repair endonuclease MutL [Pantoea sp. SoEX]
MSIKLLPLYLINQISAGEVIDRPASVVKELIENSIDAGANNINIHVKQGGMKLIQIQDNGCGIIKDELFLALKKHATSKIKSKEDLESLASLGFRGEALTSISSISRLTLISKTTEQNQAWQIYTEGNKINSKPIPTTHPVGTTVKVFDLFYNTPVRRKCMKNEKTEFNHIYSLLNQILLSRFDITLSLSNDENLIYYQPLAVTETEIKRRLKFICGSNFIQQSLCIKYQNDNLFIYGWIADTNICKIDIKIQYSYVNKRIVKNKLINNAVRKAFHSVFQNSEQPAYIIYLEIDPCQIDINIHPSKKEIRFHEPKLIYDFIIKSINNILDYNNIKKTSKELCYKENKIKLETDYVKSQSNNCFSLPDWFYKNDISNLTTHDMTEFYNNHISSYRSPIIYSKYFGKLLAVIHNAYALLKKDQKLMLMSINTSLRYLKQSQLNHSRIYFKTRPLLFPLKIKIDEIYYNILKNNNKLIKQTGIYFQIEKNHLTLYSIPSTFHEYNLTALIYAILDYLNQQKKNSLKQLINWLEHYYEDNKFISWNVLKVNILLAEIEYFCPNLFITPPSNLIQYIDINNIIKCLNNDQIKNT